MAPPQGQLSVGQLQWGSRKLLQPVLSQGTTASAAAASAAAAATAAAARLAGRRHKRAPHEGEQQHPQQRLKGGSLAASGPPGSILSTWAERHAQPLEAARCLPAPKVAVVPSPGSLPACLVVPPPLLAQLPGVVLHGLHAPHVQLEDINQLYLDPKLRRAKGTGGRFGGGAKGEDAPCTAPRGQAQPN